MRMKDGLQPCQRCGGGGCYWCGKLGYVVQCYRCGNAEPGSVERQGDEFTCQVCGSEFDKKGKPLEHSNREMKTPQTPKPVPPKVIPKVPPKKTK